MLLPFSYVSFCIFSLLAITATSTASTATATSKITVNDDSPWSAVSLLSSCPTPSFQNIVSPLAAMTALSYTYTQGSYYNLTKSNEVLSDLSAQGWQFIAKQDDSYGMRGLLLQHTTTQRWVVVFRGTDLNLTSVSGQADACADLVLFEGMPLAQLPAYCHQFNASTLDYLSAAQYFLSSRVLPLLSTESELLFTGHSLGAGLALLTSVLPVQLNGSASVYRTVCFSSPSVRDVLLNRTGLPSSVIPSDRGYDLGDSSDPVTHDAVADNQAIGNVCLWQDDPIPTSCTLCYTSGMTSSQQQEHQEQKHSCAVEKRTDFLFNYLTGEKNLAACTECFQKTHIFSHYLYDLVPGIRPNCSAAL